MTRRALKEKAVDLRMRGYSYNLIAEKLRVSKSTLSEWLSELPYTPNAEVVRRIGNAVASAGKRMAQKKRDSIVHARELAKKDIGNVTKRDLFMLGIGLYIGEGAKSPGIIRVTNADPAIIVLAMRWFRSVCGMRDSNFLLRLHVYPDTDVPTCLNYWSRRTNLPLRQFQKTYIDARVNKKMAKRGKLPYGTAHLSVLAKGNILHGAFLRRRIDGWMQCVLDDEQYAGVV